MPTTLFEFGDVVLVPFPFTDQTAAKRRPAVVDSNLAYNRAKPDLVVMAVTSQLRATAAFDEVWIRQWQEAGLLKPSAIKPVFATIEQLLVIRQLGTLQSADQAALRQAITEVIG
jgi:mRNA interferase MazF